MTRLCGAFQTSLTLGLMTAIISTTLGVLASLALVRYDFPGKNSISTLLIAPILVPEVVLAVALLLFLQMLNIPQELLFAFDGPCDFHAALCGACGAGAFGGGEKGL